MIKSNELRIGNAIWLVDKDKTYIIQDGHDIDECENNDMVKPVPLTEEILLKCGFIKCLVGGVGFDKGKLSVYIGGNTYWNSLKIIEGTPKYLHQLQNLYFALTSEELDVSALFN